MINRYYYKSTLNSFLNDSPDNIFGVIARKDEGDSVAEQKYAWSEEIETMQRVLLPWMNENGEILFEYSIPRLGKRIDVVVLLRGIVFAIEFKAGQDSYLRADMEQVLDYALDLKNFHAESHYRTIVPILVATESVERSYDALNMMMIYTIRFFQIQILYVVAEGSTPSKRWLKENVTYGHFDDDLWVLLQNKVWRQKLRDYIIEHKLTDDSWFGKIAAEGLGALAALLLVA